MKKKVVVYSKNDCPQCKMVKKFLVDKKVEFSEINIDERVEFVDELKALGFRSVPIVSSPDEAFDTVIGFNPNGLRKIPGSI